MCFLCNALKSQQARMVARTCYFDRKVLSAPQVPVRPHPLARSGAVDNVRAKTNCSYLPLTKVRPCTGSLPQQPRHQVWRAQRARCAPNAITRHTDCVPVPIASKRFMVVAQELGSIRASVSIAALCSL